MKSCHGPCEQGRKECPTPWACETDEPPETDHVRVVLIDVLIACAIVGTIAVILWRLVG